MAITITITDTITAPIIFPPLLFPLHINPVRRTPFYVYQMRFHLLVQVLPRFVLQQSGEVSVFGAGDVIVGI